MRCLRRSGGSIRRPCKVGRQTTPAAQGEVEFSNRACVGGCRVRLTGSEARGGAEKNKVVDGSLSGISGMYAVVQLDSDEA